MKNKLVIFLSSILLGVSSIFVPLFSKGTNSARAITSSDTTSYVTVNELWDSANQKVNKDNLLTLFDYVSGTLNTQYNTIEQLAEGKLTSKDMRENALSSYNGSALKEEGKDIVVTFGGLKWQVVYLSNDKNGNPILTLWLANTSEVNVTSIKFADAGNTGAYEVDTIYIENPSSLYGSSKIRTEILNAGGYKATSSTTVVEVKQNSSNVFADFTMPVDGEYNDLTDFITTPEYVEWQEFQRAKDYGLTGNNLSNEAWSNDLTSEGFYGAAHNFAGRTYNDVWKTDFIWLPSSTEIGGTSAEKGVWEPSLNQKKSDALYLTRSVSTDKDWTSNATDKFAASGDSSTLNIANSSLSGGLRPALHLNLSALVEKMISQESTSADKIYIDPVNGSDDANGLTEYMAVKTIEAAERLVNNDGEINVLNPIEITEDCILGLSKAYTLKRYYRNATSNYQGVMLSIGVYDAADDTNNKCPTVVFNNVVIDGNSSRTAAFDARDGVIDVVNGELYFEDGSGLKNHNGSNANIKHVGYAIELYNNSNITINGGTFDKNYNFDVGTIIKNRGTGKVIINDGVFTRNHSNLWGMIISKYVEINGGVFGGWTDINEDGVFTKNESLGNSAHNNGIIVGDVDNLVINGGTFYYNFTEDGGGSTAGSLFEANNIIVNKGTFTNNYDISSRTNTNGGGVFNVGQSITINGGLFENNNSKRQGGVIYVKDLYSNPKVTIKNATFRGNYSKIGGVIFSHKAGTAIDIENCIFEDNYSNGNKTLTLSDGVAQTYNGGGVIYAIGANTTIKNSTFTNNTSNGDGGAIQVIDGGTLTVCDCDFINNDTTGSFGGAIAQGKNTYVKVYSSYFDDNDASSCSGSIDGGSAVGCIFKNSNSANGGAVRNVSCTDCEFYNNTATVSGGALYSGSVTNCYFEGNSAGQHGGAIAYPGQISNCVFVGNSTDGTGGAISMPAASWYSDSILISVTNSYFENNSAATYGGAIFGDKSSLKITNSTIVGNTAGTNGGGVYFASTTGNGKISFGEANKQNKIVIENNTKTGGSADNLFLANNTVFPTIEIISNLEDGSIVYINSDGALTGKTIAKITGSDKYFTQQTINAFKYQEDYAFYVATIASGSSKTGVGLYVNKIFTDNSTLSYTASDNYCGYDGLDHTINIEVYSSVGNYQIFYSDAEDGEYTTTPITVREPGESKVVWFYLVDDSGDTYFPDSREVKISRMDIAIAENIVINTVLGAEFIKDEILPVTMSGKVVDALGNAVAVDLVYVDPTITVDYAANNKTFMVNVVPKNTEKYNTLKSVSVRVNISYDDLYFKNNTFYLDSALEAEGSFTTSDADLSQVLTLLNNNATIYFLSPYVVNTTMVLETDKNIYLSRIPTDTSSMSGNILTLAPPAKVTIGSHNMKGRITITGGDTDCSQNATAPLISVNGTSTVLNIFGNVIIEDAKLNKNTTSNIYGAGISNSGILNLDGTILRNFYTTGHGGAIYNSGTLVANNIKVENCRAVQYGSGIYSTGDITLKNSTVANNSGICNVSTPQKGIGLAVVGNAVVNIDNCIFNTNRSKNTSNADYGNESTVARRTLGGSIYFADGVEATITNSNIQSSLAHHGAGMYVGADVRVILTNTNFFNNVTYHNGSAIYIEESGSVHFVSGEMAINQFNSSEGVGTVITYGTFEFGEYGSDNAKINGDISSNYWVNGAAIYVTGTGVFKMYGGIIQGFLSQYTRNTIYVNTNAKAYIYSGSLINNGYEDYDANNVESHYQIKGELYLSTKVKVNNYFSVVLDADNKAKIHLFGDANDLWDFNLRFCSVKNGESQYINGKIFDYDAELSGKSLTQEEWEYIISKISWSNNTTDFIGSSTIEYVYDPDGNQYYAYLNPAKASNNIYFDPENGNDNNDGSAADKALLTWNKVLTKASSGSGVYLCNMWNIDVDTTINGSGIKLLRTSSLTTYMFNITSADVTLTINNLIIDGRKDFNGAQYAKDYLLAKAVIYSEKSCTINLNDTTIQNNATATSGNAIHLKVNENATKFNLNLNNSTITNNVIYNKLDTKAVGVGIYVENTTNTHTNPEVNINIKNSDVINNTIINEFSHENYYGYIDTGVGKIHGGIGICLDLNYSESSNKTINVNVFNTNFEGNLVESPENYSGSAILVLANGKGNTSNVVNLNIDKCEFINNGAVFYMAYDATYNHVGSISLYLQNAVKTKTNITNSNFYDNKGLTSVLYLKSTINGNELNLTNCNFDNSGLPVAPSTTIYAAVKDENNDINITNCNFVSCQTVFYLTNSGAKSKIEINDCYFENNTYLVNTTNVNCYINNSYSYNSYYGFNLYDADLIASNTTIDKGSYGVYLSDAQTENVSGLTILNYTSGGIYRYGNYNSTLNISDVITDGCNPGIYMSFGSGNVSASNTNQNIVNINNCILKNSTSYGIRFVSSLYTRTTTTCSVTVNINNSVITGGTYGIYKSTNSYSYDYYDYVVTNLNLSNTTVKNCTYGFYHYLSNERKAININGGYFIDNSYGLYSSNRLDINNIVALNNTTYDVYAGTAIYMSGKNNIDTMYCVSTDTTTSIFLTGAISKYHSSAKPINIKLNVTPAVGLMVVGVDSSYTPTQEVFDAFLPLFSVNGATLNTSGLSIVVSALASGGSSEIGSVAQTNVYYFDPGNKTGLASESADGKTINAPFLNLSQVIAMANTGVTVYIMSNCVIDAGTYDFKGMSFKVYFDSSNAMPYMASQNIFSTSGTTVIKNLILDGNRTDGNSITGVDFYNSNITNVGRSLTNKRILYFYGNSLTLDGVTIQNIYQTDYYPVYLSGSGSVDMTNCSFYNIYNYYGMFVSATHNVTDCEIVNVNEAFYYYYSSEQKTFKNTYFENCYQAFEHNSSTIKQTFENCEANNCQYFFRVYGGPYSSRILFKECLMNDCGYAFYSTSLTQYRNPSNLKYNISIRNYINFEDCEIYNTKNTALYLQSEDDYYQNALITIKNTTIENCAGSYAIYAKNVRVDVQNSIISNLKYGIYANDSIVELSNFTEINNCEYGIYILNNAQVTVNGAIIQNNDTGVFVKAHFDFKDGIISGNKICAINSDDVKANINISGGIIDNTNGVISKDYGGSKNIEYSIYTPGKIYISGNPTISAPIITNGFANSNIIESSQANFKIINDTQYPFVINSDGALVAGNSNSAGNDKGNCTSQIKFVALRDTTISFDWMCTTDSSYYDVFEIVYNNQSITRGGGTSYAPTVTTFTQTMYEGDVLTLTYGKNYSGISGTDGPVITNLSCINDFNKTLENTSSTISSTREATSNFYATKNTSSAYTFIKRSDGSVVPSNYNIRSTTAYYNIIATKAFTLNFNYVVRSEADDKFRIRYNNNSTPEIDVGVTTETAYTYTKDMQVGDIVTLEYYMDYSVFWGHHGVVITGLDYVEPVGNTDNVEIINAPTILLGELTTGSKVRFVVPDNVGGGDIIASAFGSSFDSAKANALANAVYVDGWTDTAYIAGSKVGVQLSAVSSDEIDWNQDFSFTLYFDPINGNDAYSGRSYLDPLKTWAAVESKNADGKYNVVIMSNWKITTNTTIDLHGKTLSKYYISSDLRFDKNDKNACIIVDGGAVLTINNTNINGNYKVDGKDACVNSEWGFIYVKNGGKLIYNNGTAYNIYNKSRAGGVIWAENADVVLNNVRFESNYANGGGAIYVTGGNLTINNCWFEGNATAARNFGGAIYFINSTTTGDPKVLTINGSTFINNKAMYDTNGNFNFGGALYAQKNVSVNIDDCLFKGNRANCHGGAIYFDAIAQANILNTTFDANRIETHEYSGLAIYSNNSIVGSSISIDGCVFKNHTVDNKIYGVIYINSAGDVTLKNSEFCHNYTYYRLITINNGVDQVSGSGKIIFENVYMHDNIIFSGQGLSINTYNGTFVLLQTNRSGDVVNVKDCVFEHNTITTESMENIAYNNFFWFDIKGTINFEHNLFKDNAGLGHLTVVILDTNAVCNNINSVYVGNQFGGNSAILYVSLTSNNTLNFDNLVVEDNIALRMVCIQDIDEKPISQEGHTVNYTGGSISNNVKCGSGNVQGFALAIEDSIVNLQGVVANNNYSVNTVYALCEISLYNCDGIVKDVVLTGNTLQGAPLRFSSSAALSNSITVENAYIANNRNTIGGNADKEYSGAGIYSRYYDDLKINNSIIENNTTTEYLGTGILGANAKITLNNTIVRNNNSKTKDLNVDNSLIKTNVGFNDVEFAFTGIGSVRGGGGIAVYGGNLTVNGGEISGNTTSGLAGGIMAYAPVLLNGTKVYNNASVVGGGMILTSDSTIINSEIYNNYARDYAGAIWVGAKLTITNSKVYNNSTQGDGAGIYSKVEQSSLVIDGVLFKNNTALGSGAGVYFENALGSITLNNSEFVNNTSNGLGTALYSEIEVNIKNTKFVANNINGDSLIYYGFVRSATLENVSISGNFGNGEQATLFGFGDAINNGIPRFNIVNSAIYGNLTQKKALIEITNNLYLSILDSTVYGNVNSGEDGKGGLISVLKGTFKLENGQLSNNFAANGASVYFANGTSGLFINSVITGHSNGLNNYCQNGAVYIDIGAEAKFINGEIKDNYVSNLNGVIYNNGSLEMTGTEVYNNLTNIGSIYNDSAGIASFENVVIYENTANKGAGIANFGIINFVSGAITSNTAVDIVNPDTSITYGEGGGVYNGDTGIFTLTDGEISTNIAGHGAGVYNNGQFILNNGIISTNYMTHSGGGIYNNIAGQLVINGGTISNNTPVEGATNTSGFGVANAGSMVMNGGEISNNYTLTTSASFISSKGGAIYGFTSSSHTRIIGGKLVDNAAGLGAGIYLEGGAVLDVYNVTIDNETRLINAKIYGRAIYSNSSTVNLINATIKSTASINSNNCYGSIYAQNSSVNISDCEFSANKENYGVITCIGGSLYITNSVFENNQTQYDVNAASGIINIEDVYYFEIEDSSFVNNKTNGNGVLRLKITNKFTGLIDNCSFVGNTAIKNGGAIAIFSETEGINNSELTISNTTFTKNNAGNSGGALYVNGGNGTTINLLNTMFGGWIDHDEDGVLDENENYGNIAGTNGGAICIAENETSPVSVVIKGEIEISYNKANIGGGIYYAYSNPTNTAENYYNLHLESGLYANITHNSSSEGDSNLYMLDSADLRILSTGLVKDSNIGITLVKNGNSEPNIGDVIIKSYNDGLPLNTTDFKAFHYDMGRFDLKLDSNQNQIILVSSSYQGSMVVNASDVVYGLDGKYKTVTAEDIRVIGVSDYSITFAKEENGVYTENAPKYMSKGNYTVWYKVVNNNNPSETVKGSLTLKITGKVLVIKEAPIASLNKGENLSQATFKGGMAISNGSSVSGTWAFADGSVQPSDTTQKYKLIFTPFNDDIYENEASIYVNVNISYYKVYYYSDGTNSGFFTDREHLVSTGIKNLSEMVSCMQDNGAIFFMSTYIVGSTGVTEENVLSNKKVFISRYALHADAPIISLPENASTLKLSIGGGSGEIIFEGRHGYAAYNETAPLFENYGILILNSNVSVSGFINIAGEASVVKNYGQLYLNGCQIYNNRSTSTTVNCKGGAIANYGEDAIVYFNGGDYRLNNTQGNTTYYGFGGFMYNEGGTVVINSGFFARNGLWADAHPTHGGFLYTDGGEVIINGGEIMFNYAWRGYGGAIYATNGAEVKLNGGRILINLASSGGAGIYIAENTSEVIVNGGEIKFNVLSSANIITDSVVSDDKQEVSLSSVIINSASVIICLVLIVFSVYFYLPKSKKFKIKK